MKNAQTSRSAKLLARVIREAGGVTALAHYCGVSESSIRYWVRRGHVTSAPAAKLIAMEYPFAQASKLVGGKHER